MIDNLSIAVYAFPRCMLTSFSVDEILLPWYVNLSTYFRGLLHKVEMASSRLKHMNSALFAFTWEIMPPAVYSRLCSRDSSWSRVFLRSPRSSALSASLIVSTIFRLLFFRVKPCSFILSIHIYQPLRSGRI